MDKKYQCDVCGISFTTWREHRQHLQSRAHRNIANKGNVGLFLDRLADGLKKLDREK